MMEFTWQIGIIVVITVVLLVGWVVYRLKEKKRYDVAKITIRDIDRMDGHEFEDYLFVLLAGLGYNETYQTKKSRDFGADLLFNDSSGARTVVQAKCLSDALGVKAIQEVFTAKVYYQAEKAIVITSTETISDPCRRLASAAEVKLIEREALQEIIALFKREQMKQAQDVIEAPPEKIKTTPEDSYVYPEQDQQVIRSGEFYYKKPSSFFKRSG
ncbi:restriction endonuclease [Halalkalibacterium halodurans]|nr:restriction endonuclease [Halalkalibacterium halodurans]MDY7220997.1 restriction endonuclease [Halalkalibacterium halodurans]MDY7240236.1 restriction endonuclease [Halalkalibacterium halodurans]MED3645901.1 restriction endonuclease [Halalkalibacterium halodurans]MED4079887.1 restriction endonuclease [Halalkalibacterium halodurans]MED4085294.1 restriction endonuclease [Halalkalibacterium halodurans]